MAEVQDSAINGVLIDPGHGGKDGGGGTNQFWKESNYVLEISLYQYKRFKELGVPVKLTRATDVYLSPEQRVKIVNSSGMKHCISNHVNAGGGDGAEFIHSIHSKSTMADLMAAEIKAVGQNVRRVFTRKLSNGADYYFMHRETFPEVVIAEYGFADSKLDDIAQLRANQLLYAEAVVKAYCRYSGHSYSAPISKVAESTPEKEGEIHMNLAKWQYEELGKAFDLAYEKGLFSSNEWGEKARNAELTHEQLSFLSVSLWYRSQLKGAN